MVEWSAEKVLTVLRGSALREPAHAWLFNVRNSTGFTRKERYADALVVSLWPSRGIWIAGIEVKISRNDWLRELDQPDKSSEIQRFCDYWWVAAPEDVVVPAEIPKTWGHYVVLHTTGKHRVRTVKAAPKLKPQPLTINFVASILRKQADGSGRLRQMGYHEGFDAARKQFDSNQLDEALSKLNAAETARRQAEQQLKYREADLSSLKQTIRDFERDAGLDIHLESYRGGGWTPNNLGKQFAAARLLSEANAQALAERFLEVGRALQEVAELTEPKKTGT